MFTIFQYGIFNSKANFECLSSNYKQNTELTILCKQSSGICLQFDCKQNILVGQTLGTVY